MNAPTAPVPGQPPRPPFEYPITFLKSETQGDVHVFLPDSFELDFVQEIANNFSRTIQQQVFVYHDAGRNKFRLCPGSNGASFQSGQLGLPVLICDMVDPSRPQGLDRLLEPPTESADDVLKKSSDQHIPRPRNSWILYRQAMSKELSKQYPGTTASELSTMISKMWREAPQEERDLWQTKAKEEDRLHKEMYPWYKYTTRKSSTRNNFQ